MARLRLREHGRARALMWARWHSVLRGVCKAVTALGALLGAPDLTAGGRLRGGTVTGKHEALCHDGRGRVRMYALACLT